MRKIVENKGFKRCVDCKHASRWFFGLFADSDPRCTISIASQNAVTGEKDYHYCAIERDPIFEEISCGPDAKNFEPR